jgi:hypothetical protein
VKVGYHDSTRLGFVLKNAGDSPVAGIPLLLYGRYEIFRDFCRGSENQGVSIPFGLLKAGHPKIPDCGNSRLFYDSPA